MSPATKVSLQIHKDITIKARLNGYGNNAKTMLNAMKNAYNTIITNSGYHDDYISHIFEAVLSSKNKVFINYMQRFKDKWQDDEEIIASDIIAKAKSKYANMTKEKSLG